MSDEPVHGITRRQTEILNILWERGEATSGEIGDALPDAPTSSTVRTLLQIMVERGLIAHDDVAYRRKYRPAVTRDAVEDGALVRLLHTRYGGSVDALLADLAHQGLLTAEALDRTRARLSPAPDPPAPPSSASPAKSARRRPALSLAAVGAVFGLGLLLGRR